MTTKKEKIWLLLHELKNVFEKEFILSSEDKIVIKRWNVKLIIQSKLQIVEVHAVNQWINFLLSEGYLRPNPTSQLSSKIQVIKPTNDTRYFISYENILYMIDILRSEIFPHTHTKSQMNIDKFLSGNPDHQDAITDNPS